MKIAVMTWFHYDNYGTVLQAAALVKALQNRGHQVDIIRYFPKEQVYSIPNKDVRRELVRNIREQRRNEQNPPIVSVIAGDTFNAFREQYLTFTDYCPTLTDLESLNDQYDVFICGSDLVWLPRYFDPRYYLDFVKDTECMIAYAPSLLDDGAADPAVLARMGDLIRRFSHLSVREESGRKMLSSVFEIQTEEVADPVLLLSVEEWNRMIDSELALPEETKESEAAENQVSGEEISEGDAAAENTEAEDAETGDAVETEEPVISETAADTDVQSDVPEADNAAETAISEDDQPEDNRTEDSQPENSESEVTPEIPETVMAEEIPVSDRQVLPVDTNANASEKQEETFRGDLVICLQGRHLLYWEAAQKLAQRLNLRVRIIPIYQNDLDRPDCIEEPVSPLRFVQLIRDAAYVCTDSYHATVLAIHFGTELCCFERYTDRTEQGRNARIRHILEAVGLSNRLYDSEAPLENFLAPIDWVPVNYKLDALRIKSDKYLDESLQSVEEHIGSREGKSQHVREGYSLCCGCDACASVCEQQAVQVVMDEKGFAQAQVDEEKCIRCGRCTEVCPMRGELSGVKIASGRLLSYTDEEMQALQGASAGALSYRLSAIMHASGCAVAGCFYDEETQEARHILVRPEEDPERLQQLKGSKYLQSSVHGLWQELTGYEGPLVIFGTPCQIAAARNVLGDRTQVYYVDIVCGGVPSQLLYKKYLKSQNRRGFFRRPLPVDCFDRMVDLDQCNMEACYECRWRDTSAADLRIGDLRTDFEGRRGTDRASLCIALTQQGTELLNQLMISGYWEGLKKENIAAYIETHRPVNPIRPVFYEELTERLGNEKVGMKRLLHEYVKPFEKRSSRWLHDTMFYEVTETAHNERNAMLPGERAADLPMKTKDK